jgi:hypothetical protein
MFELEVKLLKMDSNWDYNDSCTSLNQKKLNGIKCQIDKIFIEIF